MHIVAGTNFSGVVQGFALSHPAFISKPVLLPADGWVAVLEQTDRKNVLHGKTGGIAIAAAQIHCASRRLARVEVLDVEQLDCLKTRIR